MKEQILLLRSQGLSYSQIVEQLGCSKGTVAYYCGVGQKEKTAGRQRDKRSKAAQYIQQYKQERGCADCKEDYPYWILEFDHKDNKHFTIASDYKHVTLDVLKAEIEKCDVVCSNCHKNRTHMRLVKHGGDVLDLTYQ